MPSGAGDRWKRIKLWLKQATCLHRSIEGAHRIKFDPQGQPLLIVSRGRCLRCGKIVIPPPLKPQQIIMMLEQAKTRE